MEKPKILYVNQEMSPYTRETPLALAACNLPQFVQSQQCEIRLFVPRFSNIYERRFQLHEVIRLSGKNVAIDDVDFPLIMKVGSLPDLRLQVYFVDNDDFFSKKNMLDKNGKPYDDSDSKMIFFARGVVETAIKLSWSPDVIHCSGWFASLLPLYLRRYYKTNPMFKESKIIFSLYNETFKGNINKKLFPKLKFDRIPNKDLARLDEITYDDLMKIAIELSDGVIVAEEGINPVLLAHAKKMRVPMMPYKGEETFFADCTKFYTKILAKP